MPETANALQEFLLVAHFQNQLQLSVVELADLAAAFRAEFPVLQQVPAGPGVDAAGQQQFQFKMGPIGLPRIVLRSTATHLNVQFQEDRVCLGWSRSKPIGHSDTYPSYVNMIAKWHGIVNQFYSWSEGTLNNRPRIRLIEISYQNALPLVVDGKPRKISDIFRFVQPGNRTLNRFTTIWGEKLDSDPQGPSVMAQFGVGVAPPSTDPVFAFNFVGLGPVSDEANGTHAVAAFDALHKHILDMYHAAIIS